MRRRTLPPGHSEIALSHAVLGEVHGRHRTAPPTASALLHEALDMQRASLGDDHPAVADTLLALSALHRRAGKPEAAEPLAREAVAIRAAKLPPGHWKRALADVELATVLIALEPPCRGPPDARSAPRPCSPKVSAIATRGWRRFVR